MHIIIIMIKYGNYIVTKNNKIPFNLVTSSYNQAYYSTLWTLE